MEKGGKLRETINFIDTIQHLGIDYHFQSEIDEKLQCLHGIQFESNDLHQVALRFRLLRQNGFFVSPGLYFVIINKLYKLIDTL
jgi:Terpene synthase, N-terminal domain